MSHLREEIGLAKQAYQSLRYEGDLGEIVDNRAGHQRPFVFAEAWIGLAAGLALIAALQFMPSSTRTEQENLANVDPVPSRAKEPIRRLNLPKLRLASTLQMPKQDKEQRRFTSRLRLTTLKKMKLSFNPRVTFRRTRNAC